MTLILVLCALGSFGVALAVVGLMFRDSRKVAAARVLNSSAGSVDSGV